MSRFGRWSFLPGRFCLGPFAGSDLGRMDDSTNMYLGGSIQLGSRCLTGSPYFTFSDPIYFSYNFSVNKNFELNYFQTFWCRETGLSPPLKYFTDGSKVVFLLWIISVFVSCVSHAFASVRYYLVVTCWERADLLLVMFIVVLFLSRVVSWVVCCT